MEGVLRSWDVDVIGPKTQVRMIPLYSSKLLNPDIFIHGDRYHIFRIIQRLRLHLLAQASAPVHLRHYVALVEELVSSHFYVLFLLVSYSNLQLNL